MLILVFKLKKSLQGLKQASLQWFTKLTTELLYQGFTQSKNDYYLFIKRTTTSNTIATMYVDDYILTGDDLASISKLKAQLHNVFSINDLGKLHFFFLAWSNIWCY